VSREAEATPSLLPCPFCGGAAFRRDIRELGYGDAARYMIGCPACVVGREGHSWEEAITAWNTRVSANSARSLSGRMV